MNGIALSIDVEPWWAGDLPAKSYDGHEDIVVPAVENLLELLDEKDVRATFFILGSVAKSDPGLIKKISERGHEIGSHGYEHVSLSPTCREDFIESENATIDLLMSASGQRPVGFRAPNCSVRREISWFHETVAKDLGYLYSSSVFPMRTPLYGYPGAPLQPYTPNGRGEGATHRLVEFPFTIYRGRILRIPLCGGGYLRFQPLSMVISLLKKVLKERPAVINIHPRDIHPLGEIPDDIGPLSRFALFHGVEKTGGKLEKLLETFSFRPVREVLSL